MIPLFTTDNHRTFAFHHTTEGRLEGDNFVHAFLLTAEANPHFVQLATNMLRNDRMLPISAASFELLSEAQLCAAETNRYIQYRRHIRPHTCLLTVSGIAQRYLSFMALVNGKYLFSFLHLYRCLKREDRCPRMEKFHYNALCCQIENAQSSK